MSGPAPEAPPPDAPPPGTADTGTAETATAPDTRLRSLHPRAVALWRLGALGRGAFVLGLAIASQLLLASAVPAALLSVALGIGVVAWAIVVPPLQYDAWRFALREDHLYLRHGVLFRTTSIVPYARIQHVDTRHGPVDRYLGLASLVVYTAGTRGASVTVPALAGPLAEELRDRLAALSGAGDAV